MKKLFLVGVAALALVGGSAAAQQSGPRAGAAALSLAAFQTRVAAKFVATDANRDGFITQAEADASTAARPNREQRLAARQQRQAKRAERLARLDTNKDGTVSAAERQARAAARSSEQLERRAARVQERAERRSSRQAQRSTTGLRLNAKRLAKLDTNKDSRLSLAEVQSQAAVRFARQDKNADGSVTREERREARLQRQSRRSR